MRPKHYHHYPRLLETQILSQLLEPRLQNSFIPIRGQFSFSFPQAGPQDGFHMHKPSFTIFLRKHTRREDLVGFFAREWLADTRSGKPTGMKGVQPVLDYLSAQGYTESAVLAASKAWDEWRESWRGKEGLEEAEP